jgi:hypothetical protein
MKRHRKRPGHGAAAGRESRAAVCGAWRMHAVRRLRAGRGGAGRGGAVAGRGGAEQEQDAGAGAAGQGTREGQRAAPPPGQGRQPHAGPRPTCPWRGGPARPGRAERMQSRSNLDRGTRFPAGSGSSDKVLLNQGTRFCWIKGQGFRFQDTVQARPGGHGRKPHGARRLSASSRRVGREADSGRGRARGVAVADSGRGRARGCWEWPWRTVDGDVPAAAGSGRGGQWTCRSRGATGWRAAGSVARVSGWRGCGDGPDRGY